MKSAVEIGSKEITIGPQTEERQLIALTKCGNEMAIREVIRRLNPRLFRIARSIVDNDLEAEDIVQETYLVVFSRIVEFREDSKLSTWATKIALNMARMRLRKLRETEEYDSISETQSQSGSILDFPNMKERTLENEQGQAQFLEWLEASVSKLSSNLRIVFVLREVEGLSLAEIALDLDVSIMTVKTRLFRARRHLRLLLESKIQGGFEAVYPFDGARCAQMADSVVELLQDFICSPS